LLRMGMHLDGITGKQECSVTKLHSYIYRWTAHRRGFLSRCLYFILCIFLLPALKLLSSAGIGLELELCGANNKKGIMKRVLEEGEAEWEAKRDHIGMSNDDFDVEFFALLKQIERTKKQFGALRMINIDKPLLPPTFGIDKGVVTPKPTWQPKFVWEDLCGGTTMRMGPTTSTK
ncbi:hypothetical protein KI387_012362, partial [Taxus chinensis]